MSAHRPYRRALRRLALASSGVVMVSPAVLFGLPQASAATALQPGNLLVSTSNYVPANITAGQTQLPPGCGGTGNPCKTAVADGTYPYVFNNSTVDGSFGVTSPIILDELTPSGSPLAQITVPNSTQSGVGPTSDQLVTSFSSKSEGALNLSTDNSQVSFIDYETGVGTIDASNSNTPGAVDSTNPVTGSVYRDVGLLNTAGQFSFTRTNAYSGNNGRAAILDSTDNRIFTSGNAGNGANPEPQGVVTGAGAQIVTPAGQPEAAQTSVGAPTPVGAFNVRQLGLAADKSAKDTNFRGLTINGSTIYTTKGSGGNGVNTVYFVDPTGNACPNGTGLPTSAALPTTSTPMYSTSNAALGLTTANPGLAPTNMCVLNGFPTASAKNANDASLYPFGIWFANPTTLYVADEGAGDAAYSSTANNYPAAAASTTAGLQKWVLNTATGTWNLAYTLQTGLNLGQPYYPFGYPTGPNNTQGGAGGNWSPATDGLRNLVGHTNGDGTVTLYATTSTVSGSGDQGADPNQLVAITDPVAATSARSGEQFQTIVPPASGTVVRGVSFTPGTGATPPPATPEIPWAPLAPLAAVVVGGGVLWLHTRRRNALA